MITVVAAVNNDATLAANLLRSPVLRACGVTLQLQRGHPSAALAYRAAMGDCRHDIAVFAHQDAYLPPGWLDQLMRSVETIEKNDAQWAVLGVYGVAACGAQTGCVWSSGLDSVFGCAFANPVRVDSIDEVVIVLRRSSGVEFDAALPGYHLYATDLVQTALSRGMGAYVIYAPVVHNSRPVTYLGPDYFNAYRYVARKWRHRLPIHNNVAQLVAPGLAYWRIRARHRWTEWRQSHLDRAALDRRYDCIELSRRLGFE